MEKRVTVAKRGGRRVDREFGVSRCKLLHLAWMSNKSWETMRKRIRTQFVNIKAILMYKQLGLKIMGN